MILHQVISHSHFTTQQHYNTKSTTSSSSYHYLLHINSNHTIDKMLSKSLISILALTSMVSASPAVRRQASSTDNCVAKDNKCRTTRGADGLSANQAQCSADNAACQGACYASYNTCRTTRTNGLSANMAQCASEYASCLGENPIASTGGLISSFIPYSATASSLTTSVSTKASSTSAAATTSAAAAIGCKAKDNKCRTTRGADGLSANQAQCSADNATCQGACYASYNTCRTTRTNGLSANQAQCASEYASCLGENPIASTGGLISSFIPYSATASLSTSVSSTASAAATTSAAAAIGCKAKDNTCRTTRNADGSSANQAQCSANNAQCQGDCYAAYNTCRTTRTNGLSANQAQCVSEFATCLGENPVASSGGLISSFIPYTATASTMATSTVKASSASSAAPKNTGAAAPGSNPKKVDGKTWTLNNVNRYCGENSGTCDYNFDIVANSKTEHCTIVNASNKSFDNQKCANGDYTVSWGYVAEPAPAFAVVTVVDKQNELAWFGVSNVDGQAVTASNPKGSGQYGNVGPEQVYTYN